MGQRDACQAMGTPTLAASATGYLAAILAVVAVGLRLAAVRGDFVLDEIWSWTMATRCRSPWQVLTWGHDNNHVLNTFVLYWLQREVAHKWLFRLPAALASCLGLWFGYDAARRDGNSAGTFFLALLGLSELVVVYGSEARGYGYLICFALAAWWALERYFERPTWRWIAVFGLASSLALLAHLTFLFAYAGLAVYSGIKLVQRRRGLPSFVALHAIPAATGAVLYFVNVRGMRFGGGTDFELASTLITTLSLMAGGPEQGPLAWTAAAVGAVLLVASLVVEVRRDQARGAVFATTILLAPALMLTLVKPAALYPRYFLVPAVFAYLVVAVLLSRWWQAGRFARGACAGLLAVYAASNLGPLFRLVGGGRAEYSAAVCYMAQHSPGPTIAVAGDHDFRNELVAYFHAAQNPDAFRNRGKRLVYIDDEHYGPAGADWYLAHSFAGEAAKPEKLADRFGNRYELVHIYPSNSLSGWTWWLYRRRRAGP